MFQPKAYKLKLQIISDVHLESNSTFPLINKSADVLVYAGDVGEGLSKIFLYFTKVRLETSSPIIYVLGNHEYFGKYLASAFGDVKTFLKTIPDIFVLEKDSKIIDDVCFIGTTLWTNFDDYRGEQAVQAGMPEYRAVRTTDQYCRTKLITTRSIVKEHLKCKEYIEEEIINAKRNKLKTVIVTHTCPSFKCATEKEKKGVLVGAFYTELSEFISCKRPDLWIYGHTHNSKEVKVGRTRVISNQFGYRNEQCGFVEEFIVEI